MKLLGSTLLFLTFAITISITITNIPMSFSQTGDNPQLFTPIVIGSSSSIQIPISDTITQTKIVQVNMNALQAEQVDVSLFGHTITISKDRVTTNDDYYAWFGSGDLFSLIF